MVCKFIFGDGVFIVDIVCSEVTVCWQRWISENMARSRMRAAVLEERAK